MRAQLSKMRAENRSFTRRRKGAKETRRRNSDFASFFAALRLRVKHLGLVLSGLILLTSCNTSETTNSKTPVISNPPTGTTYPMPPTRTMSLANMGWQLADGKRSIFSDYKGKVLILDFYATWCVPCRDSVPHLIGLQKKFEDQGLAVVGLNVGGPGDEREVPAFAKEFGIQYTLAKPDDDLVSFLMADSDAIPQTFVFDRQGQLVQRFVGFGSDTGVYMDGAVETALKTPAQ